MEMSFSLLVCTCLFMLRAEGIQSEASAVVATRPTTSRLRDVQFVDMACKELNATPGTNRANATAPESWNVLFRRGAARLTLHLVFNVLLHVPSNRARPKYKPLDNLFLSFFKVIRIIFQYFAKNVWNIDTNTIVDRDRPTSIANSTYYQVALDVISGASQIRHAGTSYCLSPEPVSGALFRCRALQNACIGLAMKRFVLNEAMLILDFSSLVKPQQIGRIWPAGQTGKLIGALCWEPELSAAQNLYSRPGRWDVSPDCVAVLKSIATRIFDTLVQGYLRIAVSGTYPGRWRILRPFVALMPRLFDSMKERVFQFFLYPTFNRLEQTARVRNAHRSSLISLSCNGLRGPKDEVYQSLLKLYRVIIINNLNTVVPLGALGPLFSALNLALPCLIRPQL